MTTMTWRSLLAKELRVYGAPPKNLEEAVLLPLKEFIARDGLRHALMILAFVLLYKVGDNMATALATKFYLDLGFWAALAGGVVGGVWMIKLGIKRGLWVFVPLQAIAILGFAWLAQVGPNPRYTAPQYALFSSLLAVPRTFINSSVGYIVDQTRWRIFFILCFALAIPAMLMPPKIAPWSAEE